MVVLRLPNPWGLGLAAFGKGVFTDVTTLKDLEIRIFWIHLGVLIRDKQERRRPRPDGDREGRDVTSTQGSPEPGAARTGRKLLPELLEGAGPC